MRLKLILSPQENPTYVPINYQYQLSAAIYKVLAKASPAYADFLHQRGYPAPSGKLLKLFTFSRLWIPNVRRQGTKLTAGRRSSWILQVASPMLDEFVQNFVLGLFESTEIVVAGGRFFIEQVETLPMPEFKETTHFKCLSPIVVSTMRERGGKLMPYYYRPHDPALSEAIRQNLLQKHEAIHQCPPDDERLSFTIPEGYKPKSRLITLKEGTPEETQIKAFETYFDLTGSVELMRVAWECGVGEKNSQGFGMVEVVG